MAHVSAVFPLSEIEPPKTSYRANRIFPLSIALITISFNGLQVPRVLRIRRPGVRILSGAPKKNPARRKISELANQASRRFSTVVSAAFEVSHFLSIFVQGQHGLERQAIAM